MEALLIWMVVGIIAIMLFGKQDTGEIFMLIVVMFLIGILLVLGWPFVLYGIRRYSNQS